VFGYPAVEAAYQAAKTTDPAVRARIRGRAAPHRRSASGAAWRSAPDGRR